MRGRDGLQARVLTQRYVGWLIPLILVQLRSDQHRIRRQALVLLRTMCLHLSVDISCVYRVDELGPSIVSDIPAIASRAAVRLTEAVALAFAGHSVAVLMETVRQIHAHSAYGPQFAAFIGMVRPWLVNIVLRQADSAVENNDEDMSLDRVACLDPVALSRESLLVLQCMLYMTIKTGHDSMSSMQELWLALAGDNGYDTAHSRSGGKGAHNIWLIIRYLTGLLVHSKSHALLGYMRRISVFLTRSLQGPELVKMLVDESMQPSAAVPLGATDIPARNIAMGMISNERWAAEIHFASQNHHNHHHYRGNGQNAYQHQQQQQQQQQRRLLVSTGGLAMFYLGAISYEQPDVLAAYQSLAVLPSSMILLANPERWVRDAARTVLVNLVASERARCTHVMHLASDSASASASASASTSSVEQSIQANDAAHSVLSVLRGDECMTGFGNLDEEDLDGTHGLATTGLQKSRSYYRQQQHERQDSRFSDDDDDGGEDALHGWSPVSISAADYLERGGSADAHKDQADTNEDQNKQREQHQHQQQQQRVLHGSDSVRSVGSSSIDAADSSVVADVADFAAAITQSVSPAENTGSSQSMLYDGPDTSETMQRDQAGNFSSKVSGLNRGAKRSATTTADDDCSDPASIRRRSSAVSRRSFNASEYMGDVASSKDRATLQRFVVQMSRLFGKNFSGCAQQWADVAVQWAMSCPVRPLAGLALQVFSALAMEAQYGGSVVITPTRTMILRLVDRLSNVVGDPSPEFSAFAETVLAGLRQTAGLAARMCAGNRDIKADLLAASLALMMTAQTNSVYSMALGIFERIFPLVESEVQRFRDLVAQRAGPLCALGYQPALLRGLEFANCRERCLKLLRDTLEYD
ncbi:Cell morphogenesis protein PAG1, partial [Coemansia erecta]